MAVLEATKLQELYKKFREQSPWREWHNDYLRDVQYFKSLSEQEFLEPGNQEKLWRAKGVSGIGAGEAVNVKSAYTDQQVAQALLDIRKKSWPDDIQKRAKAFSDAYDQIMDMIYGTHATQRPQAKLSRLLTALFPEDLHTCYQWQSRKHLHELVLGTTNFSFCEGGVRVRSRIREALGKEDTQDEHIWRSMFCWWLHTKYESLQQGQTPPVMVDKEEGARRPDTLEDEEQAPQKLKLWSITKQRRGFPAISSYLEAFRMLITVARGGATPEDLVETLKATPEFAKYSSSSCRQIFNMVRNLGFLENKNGLWHPSEAGEELVEDDPANILVEKLFIQAFGFAHLVQKVEGEGEVSKKDLFSYLRELYPRWTSNFMPNALLAWLKSLGIVDFDANGKVKLSDYGKSWAKRLPERLQTPEEQGLLEETLLEIDEEEVERGTFSGLTSSAVWQKFCQDQDLKGFVFTERQVEALHLAWHCNPRKRFAILSGLSGTGKTALLCHYSRIYCKSLELDPQQHQAVVAVSPDWRDPSGILGYFNALHADPTFQIEPALRLVLSTAKNPQFPYFLILDEMNLARVERYFAPFLSSMETGERLVLHANDDPVNGVPPSIRWPSNLFIGGTVNMDETTHPFSDKVLDRAFTMEFWDVRLEEFFERRASENGNQRKQRVETLLLQLNSLLFRIRRHFGYRTAGEILDFLDTADGPLDETQSKYWSLVDQAFFSKILPRIRGEGALLTDTLLQIGKICEDHNLEACTAKIKRMNDQLSTTGITRFWA